LLGRELHLLVGDLDDAPHQIDREIADPEHRALPMHLQLMAQRRPHAREQLVHAERLGDVVVGAEIERRDLAGLVPAARQDRDRHALVARAQGAQEVEALHVGQPEIENDQIRLLLQELQRGLAVRRFQHLIALRGEAHAQQLANRGLVVDHQDLERGRAHAAVSSCLACGGIGSLTENTAPGRAVRFAALMLPCIASTKPREMARPNPVPARTPSPLVARQNLSKISSSSSGGMPSPSSTTCRQTASRSRQLTIRIIEPSGEYFAALSSRLNRTCSNRTASRSSIGSPAARSSSTWWRASILLAR